MTQASFVSCSNPGVRGLWLPLSHCQHPVNPQIYSLSFGGLLWSYIPWVLTLQVIFPGSLTHLASR